MIRHAIRAAAAMAASAVLATCAMCVAQTAAKPSGTAPSESSMTTKGSPATPERRAHQAYFQTLAAFLLKHDRDQAEQGFQQVTKIDPAYAPAWFNLAVFAEADRNWSKAQGDFQEYLRLAPTGPDADRARSQLQLLARYQSGSVTPDQQRQADYDASIQRARAFLAAGLYRESIAEAGRAESTDNSRWEAYAVVSLCMARQRRRDEALKFETLAVNHAPAEKRMQVHTALLQQIDKSAPMNSGP